jgi:hypothetical protein
MALRTIVVLAVAVLAAPAAPAGSMVIKDDRGRCQMTAPSDATVVLYMATGPNKSYSISVQHEPEKHKVLTAAEIKQMHYARAVENSPSRIWVEQDPEVAGPGRRAWFVYVPTANGRCAGSITFKTGSPEGPLKAAAASLAAVK